MNNTIISKDDNVDIIYGNIEHLINNSKNRIYTTINTEILNLYWNIGKIILDIQDGKKRAKYGKNILKDLSEKLTTKYGKGFLERNLEMMRKFYILFQKSQTLSSKLSWSHYVELIKVEDDKKRCFYMNECIKSNWSVRELQRQIKSKMYDRLINKKENYTLNSTNNDLSLSEKHNFLKDPYVLEFLNLKTNNSEKELENHILEHLKEFLLELGRGYSFIGRQIRITIGNNNYYPDLIFYNNISKKLFDNRLKNRKI